MTDESLLLDIEIVEKRRERELAEKNTIIANKDKPIANKDKVIANKNSVIAALKAEIKRLQKANH